MKDFRWPIGKEFTITIDRPLGSFHPNFPLLRYPINYGYVEGIPAADGEYQDVYLLGVSEPVKIFTATIIAVIHRLNDIEDKWVAAPQELSFSCEDIQKITHFQEQYFQSVLFML